MRRGLTVLGVLLPAAGLAMAAGGCSDASAAHRPPEPRVLILGMDGMDPKLVQDLMDAGRMPNFSKVAAAGTFMPLETAAPPQSPVAWSNFICGADPGTHNIFDFIHRDLGHGDGDPVVLPYLSTSAVEPPSRDWAISFGDWRIPLFASTPVSLRRGGAFWDDLIKAGVETVVYRIPANYPPPEIEGREFDCICGMGTPDLLGTYGEFTFFTPTAPVAGRNVGGGRFARLRMRDDRGTGRIIGPGNFLRKPDANGRVPDLEAAFEIVRDPKMPVAKITIGDEVVLLKQGEWSDWVPVRFETGMPFMGVDAMVRFYLKSVRPQTELYVTPVNIDPLKQVTSIGAPDSFPAEVAQACGRFYTTGIPEDTKALRSGALTEDEFLQQVHILTGERFRQFHYALDHFDKGCLFFYFGHTDQLAHIFWRDRDPGHPAYDPDDAARYGTVVEDAYVEMDGLVGDALATLDPGDTIIIMSDHGFTSFRRGVNLNTWLIDNGYMKILDGVDPKNNAYLSAVDWSGTKAYALGLNGFYLNQAGRERMGVVKPGAERTALLHELKEKLLAIRDDGKPVIDEVYIVEEVYPDADPSIAPDILVGYADTYRASWATAEGGSPPGLFEDNTDRWSGDHCIAHQIVPGILVTNRKVRLDDPNLTDLAPSVLGLFGIAEPDGMTGRDLFLETDRGQDQD